jgi:hypothetical protein
MARAKFKLSGGSLTCPPGFHCLDTGTVMLIILIALSVLAIAVFVMKYNTEGKQIAMPKPTVVVVESKRHHEPQVVVSQQPDPRFNPASPERNYTSPPDMSGFGNGIPINIPTRGVPESFQQVGVLTTPGGTETSGSPTRTILPIFGRKLLTNRDRWNYYTRTDGINPVQVPVQFKRRNCDDDLGCEEIMDGDSIGVPILGQSFTASVYRYSTPRYIPMV